MKKIFLGILVVISFLWTSVASAITFSSVSADYNSASVSDGVTYNNYYYGADALPIAPTIGTHLVSSLSFSSLVTSTFTGLVGVAGVTDWSLQTGSITLNSSNSTLVYGLFGFNNGQLTSVFTAFSQDHSLPLWVDLSLSYSNVFITAEDNNIGITKSGVNGAWVSSQVSAVPEPFSYAMLLTGLALVSVSARRKPD
ncbi:MAG TPA: PEP-CTERM sorting domain-containing protein [Methylovorus sp.]|jgi:hypothetical protein|nr:PEP-CTERM sorting domain-containing protein [Methylovorus sp.]